jgi:hypothetical protein
MTQPLQPNLVGLTLAPAQCVSDIVLETTVNNIVLKVINEKLLNSDTLISDYITAYRQWITNSSINKINGLEKFTTAAYSNGTSEAFDKFYLKHSTRKFRCFRGEYLYHRLSWETRFEWSYLDDVELSSNDAVVVSLPFADTGNQHHLYNKEFLDKCYSLNIPVLLDCAFFGICGNLDFDFTHPAITDICFSLSKSFPVNNFRIGIRFTRVNDGDSLLVYHNAGYINKLSAAIGLELLKIQNADYMFNRYRDQQIEWCKQHDLEASSTVIFGLDKKEVYSKYNRGMNGNNRICFAKHFNNKPLPKI